MSQNFYISDLHLGHLNVIKFDNRPFNSLQEMEDTIVSNWNSVVQKGDTVYLLGDIIWKAQDDEWVRIMNRLNGNKVLIRGNHDLKEYSGKVKKCFQDIKDYKIIKDNGRQIILCHYPILFYKGSYGEDIWHFCGHTHVTREEDYCREFVRELVKRNDGSPGANRGHIINVGCMHPWMNYTPRTADELIAWWHIEYEAKE